MKSLADRVRLLVDVGQKGSVNTAAKDIGVSQPSLNRIVNGTTLNPSEAIIGKIAWFYGVSPKWLRTGKDAPAWIETGTTLDSPLGGGPPPAELRKWSLAIYDLGLPEDVSQELTQLPFAMATLTTKLVPFAQQNDRGYQEAIRLSLLAWFTWLETFLRTSGTGGVSTILRKESLRYAIQLSGSRVAMDLFERGGIDVELMSALTAARFCGATNPLDILEKKRGKVRKGSKSSSGLSRGDSQ